MTFRPDRIVHRIAMIYREVETCGGIQRGASFQANQFRGWGIEPVILSEADLGAAARPPRLPPSSRVCAPTPQGSRKSAAS